MGQDPFVEAEDKEVFESTVADLFQWENGDALGGSGRRVGALAQGLRKGTDKLGKLYGCLAGAAELVEELVEAFSDGFVFRGADFSE